MLITDIHIFRMFSEFYIDVNDKVDQQYIESVSRLENKINSAKETLKRIKDAKFTKISETN